MALNRIDSANETIISINGSAQISEVESLATELAAVLDLTTRLVTLDLNGTEELDITFYQLILVFNNDLVKQGRQLIVRTLPSDHVVMTKASQLGIKLEHYLTLPSPIL